MKTEDILQQIKYCKCGQKATFDVKVMEKFVPMCSNCANKRPKNEKVLL